EGGGVHGVVFDGRRYDTGDKLSYLKAVIQLAMERDDIGDDLREWISEQEL
ncbi:MAG: UTP--glucose-1-phosphate uridylyltransferase, partial [Actinomycetota bacterium]|nr:UTP--glucose-1-phosphate uridylyltransferase [Actinomycetota bacterium]